MRMLKTLVAVLVVVGAVGAALAGDQPKPGTTATQPGVVTAPRITLAPNPCPQGWHMAQGWPSPSGAYICVPNKPPKPSCPPKTQPLVSDCQVGCTEIIY